MKKKLQKFGIILGIMSIFGNNKKHNDKFLKEFRNRIMMKILSIIPTSLDSSVLAGGGLNFQPHLFIVACHYTIFVPCKALLLLLLLSLGPCHIQPSTYTNATTP